MNRDEIQKKENDREESWNTRMNALESLWKTKMAESRLEYMENFIQLTKKRTDSGERKENVNSSSKLK